GKKAEHSLRVILINKPTRICAGIFLLLSANAGLAAVDPKIDWPAWRGPSRNGIAETDQQAPLKWNETENVLWKAPLPGRGHGSPTVVGDRIYLATADQVKQSQSMLCVDRHSGKIV